MFEYCFPFGRIRKQSTSIRTFWALKGLLFVHTGRIHILVFYQHERVCTQLIYDYGANIYNKRFLTGAVIHFGNRKNVTTERWSRNKLFSPNLFEINAKRGFLPRAHVRLNGLYVCDRSARSTPNSQIACIIIIDRFLFFFYRVFFIDFCIYSSRYCIVTPRNAINLFLFSKVELAKRRREKKR